MSGSHSSCNGALCSGVGDEGHHDFSLENQAGEAVLLDKADREALVMGLSLHDKGSRTLQQARGFGGGSAPHRAAFHAEKA